MAHDTANTDLWIDRETGKVVKKQPARGTLLAREGSRITPAVQVRLDAVDADPDAPAIPAAVALGYETASTPDVEKAADTDKQPAKRAAKPSK